jgi:outer membrane biosynthesis protein TonB
MDKHELQTLRARFWDAKVHNFQIGAAEAHVEALQALAGRVPGDGSVDHLIELVDQALLGKPAAHPEVKKVAPKLAAPAPAPKAAPKAEPKKEEPKKVEPKAEPKVEKPAEEKPADEEIDFDNF